MKIINIARRPVEVMFNIIFTRSKGAVEVPAEIAKQLLEHSTRFAQEGRLTNEQKVILQDTYDNEAKLNGTKPKRVVSRVKPVAKKKVSTAKPPPPVEPVNTDAS